MGTANPDTLSLALDYLHDPERELREAQRVSHSGSWYWDAKTDSTVGSDELLRIYGFDPASQAMPNFNDQRGRCYPEEDWEKINAAVQQALQTGIGYELDVRAYCAQKPIWVTTRCEVVSNSTGAIIGLRGTVHDITERKQTELELRTSQARFHALVMATADVIYRMSPDWSEMHYLDGKNFLENTQQSSETWLTRYIPQAIQEEVTAHIEKAIRSQQVFQLEHQVLRTDGSLGWVFSRAIPIFDEHGELLEWFGAANDITERKQSEIALENSEKQLRFVLQGSELGFWDWDIATGKVERNAQWAEMLGYTYKEIQQTPKQWTDFIHPDDRERAWNSINAVLEKLSSIHRLEYRMFHKDGSIRWILDQASVMQRDADGKPLRMCGTHTDITARKHAEKEREQYRETLEEQVQQRTADLRAAQRIASVGSWRLDLATNAVTWSDELYRMFNADPNLPPPNFSAQADIFTPRSWDILTNALGRTVETGVPYELELETQRSDGSNGWILARGERLCDDAGNAVTIQGIAMDITLRKDTEKLLNEAKESAEAANIAKSAFLANMSHELRTPMTGVMGMIDLAKRRMTDPKGLDQLNKAKLSAERLLGVLNNVLDISKIEARHMLLDTQPLQIAEIVENVSITLGQKALEKGLHLSIDLPPTLAHALLEGDSLRLGQILVNLVGNAIKFADQGEIILRARQIDEKADSVQVRFEVVDTGIGINAEAQARLFHDFEQADNSMTRKYGGTGLGLAICRRLAQLMGGEIGVNSTPGSGSTFWLVIPLRKRDDVSVPTEPGVPAPTAIEQLLVQFAGMRILLAEDEPISQEVARGLLEYANLLVDIAENGQQALDMARQNHYALILMDIQMPVLNGIEAAKAIRANSMNHTTPIIAMTANAFDEDRAICLAAGMNAHISKPVVLQKLYETLLEWLGKRDN